MSTLDMTDKAICAALSANTPLTHEQRAVLLTVVMDRARQDLDADRYRWLRGNGWGESAIYATGPKEWGVNGIALLCGDQLDGVIDGAIACGPERTNDEHS